MAIMTVQGVTAFESYDSDDERCATCREPGTFMIRCKIPANLLNNSHYLLSVHASIPDVRELAQVEGVLAFDVKEIGAVGLSENDRRGGVIRPKLEWERQPLEA